MSERKTSRTSYLTVVSSNKRVSCRCSDGSGDIYEEIQTFRKMHKHLQNSTRPRGWFHRGYSSHQEVEVRWLWTDKNGYFAPEISYQPTKASIATAKWVAECIVENERSDKDNPDGLIEKTEAFVVEYVNDDKEGGYDDYVCRRAPGDTDMMVIARAAQGG